jgi:hypothetical protein
MDENQLRITQMTGLFTTHRSVGSFVRLAYAQQRDVDETKFIKLLIDLHRSGDTVLD